MHPNIVLLQNYVKIFPDTRILCSGLEDAEYLASVAQKVAEVHVLHWDGRVVETLQRQLAKFPNIEVSDAVFPTQTDYFNMALIGIPKGRAVTRALLTTSLQALKLNASGFVVGANKGGIKTALTDMQSLTRALSLGTKQRHRIISMTRTTQTQLSPEWLDFAQPQPVTMTVADEEYTVHTQPGVFSYAHLDDGTGLLLETLDELEIIPNQRFLDAGCGYGIVGMVLERKFAPAQVVWADVDLLALNCVRMSLPDKRVVYADLAEKGLPDDARFDWIICNPPFHEKHAVDTSFMHHLVENAPNLLKTKGQMLFVYNSFLPYLKLLEANFTAATVVAENSQFRVVHVQG